MVTSVLSDSISKYQSDSSVTVYVAAAAGTGAIHAVIRSMAKEALAIRLNDFESFFSTVYRPNTKSKTHYTYCILPPFDLSERFAIITFMPTYNYSCPQCGHFEKFQKMSEDSLTECPTCGDSVKKVYSAPGISGFTPTPATVSPNYNPNRSAVWNSAQQE
jgi:putative FmdB family regulatory protein